MELEVWIDECKKVDNTTFAIDTTNYDGKMYNKCLYALSGKGKNKALVGAYSEKSGGKVFNNGHSVFSIKDRTFEEVVL